MNVAPLRLHRLPALVAADLQGLVDLLLDCVAGGASVSFMKPLDATRARVFWQQVDGDLARGARALLVAEDDTGIVGTVQLILAQPENQPHRADLSKLLVHRRARRRGVGEALMRGAETLARDHGKSLLVLDTASDSAERLYERLGWQRCGTIPGYALLPDGGLCDTIVFYKDVAQSQPKK